MIFDISDQAFKNIMDDPDLALPKRWNGNDFRDELQALFDHYIRQFNTVGHLGAMPMPNPIRVRVELKKIKNACKYILRALERYFDGFPSKAYAAFQKAMDVCMGNPLKIYQKSVYELFESDNYRDELRLYRVVKVDENINYGRKRVFHTPYTLRNKVSTSRYSIAGFPSLYLGTSLELCCREVGLESYQSKALAARFRLEREMKSSETDIRVIELGIKPQDFIRDARRQEGLYRSVSDWLLQESEVRSAYLLWYPLIAACSFIRKNKADPFAAEYVIPQLLMQWVRDQMGRKTAKPYDPLVGIRYFSCASVRCSDMGFNYVFPTSGVKSASDPQFCAVLTKAFRLTEPVYTHEYDSVRDCEYALDRKAFDSVFADQPTADTNWRRGLSAESYTVTNLDTSVSPANADKYP